MRHGVNGLRAPGMLALALAILVGAGCGSSDSGSSSSSSSAATDGTGPGTTGGNVPGVQTSDLVRWNEYEEEFVLPAKRDWLNPLNDSLAGLPSHANAFDLVLQDGQTADLVGSFRYGSALAPLAGEEVGLFVRMHSGFGWTHAGDAVTDADGRAVFAFPSTLITGEGLYFARMVAYGDLACADSTVKVLSGLKPAVVFDLDGTLTTEDDASVAAAQLDYLSLHRNPRMREGANKLAHGLAAADYEIVYLTARPWQLALASRRWLARKGFPLGSVVAWSSDVMVQGTDATNFKTDMLDELTRQGLRFDYAFGDHDSDVFAYANAGIDPAKTYILGAYGGMNGTVPLNAYADLYGSLVAAPGVPYRAVLVVIEGLRADAMEQYLNGIAGAQSTLKRLFGSAVRVANAEACVPGGAAAQAGIFTGRQPSRTGVTGDLFLDRDTATVYDFRGTSWDAPRADDTFRGRGQGNRALQGPTLFEQMSASGRYGVAAGGVFFRGAEYIEPTSAEVDVRLANAAQADEEAVDRLLSRMGGGDLPDLAVVQFSGLADASRLLGGVGAQSLTPVDLSNTQIAYLANVIDPQLERLEQLLAQEGVLGETVFVLCSDGGMHDTGGDELHAIGLDATDYDNELEDVLEYPNYTDCWDKPYVEGDFDCFAGANGGLLHINLQNRATGDWADAPRFDEDVLPVVGAIQHHRWVGRFRTQSGDAVEEVLVRTASGYQVVRPTRVRITYESVRVLHDHDDSSAGDIWIHLRANNHEFALAGEYQANDGDLIALNQSYDIDVMPGMELVVESFVEDSDGLWYESLGTALQGFADRSAIGSQSYTLASDLGDYELTFRLEILPQTWDAYPQLAGWGHLCPIGLLSGLSTTAAAQIEALNHEKRSGDIVLLARSRQGFHFGDQAAACGGSIFAEDTAMAFYIGGQPVAQPVNLVGGGAVDVAPTLADILGFELRQADGVSRVDKNILPLKK